MSPCRLLQFITHGPVPTPARPVASVPVTVSRLSESAQIGPVILLASYGTPFRSAKYCKSRPAASEYSVVLLVPSAISRIAVGPFCRSAPLLPWPDHGTPAATSGL